MSNICFLFYNINACKHEMMNSAKLNVFNLNNRYFYGCSVFIIGNALPIASCVFNFCSMDCHNSLQLARNGRFPMIYRPYLARERATQIRFFSLRNPICPLELLRTNDRSTMLASNPWKLSTVEIFNLILPKELSACNTNAITYICTLLLFSELKLSSPWISSVPLALHKGLE